MSFGTTLALLVGALVGLPVIAHLLRRGKTEEVEFPPAYLVPAAVVTSDKRSRLEDRALLALRCLTVLLLAILGATPFVQCSHVSVDREGGASVALAIVLDDSQSMQAVVPGSSRSRFERAKTGALQLLDSAREGDAIAIVAGGVHARLLLNATTDLDSARRIISNLQVSDRATDASAAVALARAALKELPHADKRVAVFSDQHDAPPPAGTPRLWFPLPELTRAADNCGIAEAVRSGSEVSVTVGCTSQEAAINQRIELRLDDEGGPVVQDRVLEPRARVQNVTFTRVSPELSSTLVVRLVNDDAITRDNQAVVSLETAGLTIGVVADRERTSAVTGGPPLIEQAFEALGVNATIRPLTRVPDTSDQLEGFAGLVIDDPHGFSPEARAALEAWLNRGGVLLGLLGPNSVATELATSSEPLARPGVQWETNTEIHLDPGSLGVLGAEAQSLGDLRQTGRVRLDAADLPGTLVRGKWNDGVPFLFERGVGRGTVMTVGLPTTLDVSDFAIRPGFLALLDVFTRETRARSGPRRTHAGAAWTFPSDATVTVDGPPAVQKAIERGTTELAADVSPERSIASRSEQRLVPALTGVYRILVDERAEQRVVTIEPRELFQKAEVAEEGADGASTTSPSNAVDASPYWALVVLGLFAAELAYRAFRARLQVS
jgi:hypothetical protein